jgi:hypothetical protein
MVGTLRFDHPTNLDFNSPFTKWKRPPDRFAPEPSGGKGLDRFDRCRAVPRAVHSCVDAATRRVALHHRGLGYKYGGKECVIRAWACDGKG